MEPKSSSTRACPACGRELSSDTPEGLCPHCVFRELDPDALPGEADPTDEVGRSLGDYDLVDLIARGGMGVVFKARHRQLRRWVAVKVVSGGIFASPDFVQRFRTEAEAAAALDHPNIVPIYEVAEVDGHLFFSMKLLEGGTLVDRARGAPMMPTDAARVLAKIARAVHYAHQRGILHRDIKPNNILLDSAGEPYLTDFGLAKLVGRDSTLTHTIAVLGTPAYMPPEQARGEARSLTTAADVYGLGAVLYELLTGQPPFAAGTSMETVRLVLELEPRRPSLLQPEVDRDLETICLKCLEKDASRRYGSAEDLAEDLDRWLRREPIRARPSTAFERLGKWVRRRPAVAALSAVAITALAAAFVQTLVFSARLGNARRQVAAEADANRQGAIRLLVAEAARAVDDGDYCGALLPMVEALRRDAGHPAREDLQRRRLGTLLRQTPSIRRMWFHAGAITHASLSADGHRLATAGDDGIARVWSVETGDPIAPPLLHTSRVMQVVFSPDSRRLATQERSGFAYLWDLASGTRIGAARPHRSAHYEPMMFSPDGTSLAVPGPNVTGIWPTDDPTKPPILLPEAGAVQGLGFDHRGERLVTASLDTSARVWDVRTGALLGRPLAHPQKVRAALFLPGDQRIMTIAEDWRVRVWDATSGQLLVTGNPHQSDILTWAVSPDGSRLVTGSFDNTAKIWDPLHGGPPLASLPHAGAVIACNLAQDGTVLSTASIDGVVRRWSVATGQSLPPSLQHAAGVWVTLLEPTLDRLITGSDQGDVRQWRIPPHQGARSELRFPTAPVFASRDPVRDTVLAVSRDGVIRQWFDPGDPGAQWTTRHITNVSAAAVSLDRRWLAAAGEDGRIALWETGRDASIRTFAAHEQTVNHLDFSPDGLRLVSASDDYTAAVWDLATGTLALPRLVHERQVLWAEFSPDGRWLATSGHAGEARIWEAATGQLRHTATQGAIAVASLRFAQDSRSLVLATWDHSTEPRSAMVWRPFDDKANLTRFWHRDGVRCAVFSPDGRFIATGGEDNLARVWLAEDGHPITPFLRHRGFVVDVAFSPDSRMVATASHDGTARVWDTTDGQAITPPLRHEGPVLHVEFASGGRSLLSTAANGAVRSWDLSPVGGSLEDLAQLAELLASHRREPEGDLRPLTAAEMRPRWESIRGNLPETGIAR